MEIKLEEKYIGIKPGGLSKFEPSNLGIIYHRSEDGIYTSNCGRIRVTEDEIRHDLKMGFIKPYSEVTAECVNNKPNNKLQEAVEVLCKALKENEDYYRSWKANIAMAFKDEYSRTPEVFKHDIHTIANEAADNFLKQLIK